MTWPWWTPPVAAGAIALFFVSGGVSWDRAAVQWGTWALLAYPILWVDHHLPVAPDALGRRALWHIPLSVASTLAYVLAQRTFSRLVSAEAMDLPSLTQAVSQGALHWNILYYWLIVGAHFAVEASRQGHVRKQRAAELEQQLAQAQLSALRSQLQPHFLFNALNLIAADIESHPTSARTMVAHLGDLLRATLQLGTQEEIPLQEELALLEHYLAIQRARFAGRLTVDVCAEPAALDVLVPPLLLQPLVENAMHHGLAQTIRAGHLVIEARVVHGHLHLAVRDNGVGLPAGWSREAAEGTGLATTRRRLATLCGDTCRFDMRRVAPYGTAAVIEMPARYAPAARGPAA